VLDFGEDHADNWWEFYDLAQFDLYRQEQTEFINNIISEARYEEADIKYRMLISHIPVTYVLGNFLKEIKAEWTNLLNAINFDLALSGHHHQLLPITREIPANSEFLFHENYTEDSGKTIKYRTDSNFDTFIVSRRSNEQAVAIKENLYGKELSGLAVSVNYTTEVQTIYYTNTLKEVVEIVDPYTGVTKQEYLIDLK
ncbi:MAG: hypothetical protein PHX62_07075, partial [Bacilli bacterium]|nr:hypothetical protein [Bacilli bacterium]